MNTVEQFSLQVHSLITTGRHCCEEKYSISHELTAPGSLLITDYKSPILITTRFVGSYLTTELYEVWMLLYGYQPHTLDRPA